MFSGSNIGIHGGTFINQNRTSKGMDILLEWIATGAFHNSDELYDTPKCHPHTRVAVLDDIMKWVGGSESVQDDFMMWLFGPAGAGKSAIAKRAAELAADMGMLIATFFFSRTSTDRSNKDRLIATIAYQLALSYPETRSYIENAIEQDPAVFRKNIPTQIDTLLVKPFQSIPPSQIVPSKKLIIIDGLDECNDSKVQVAILEAISHSFPQYNLPIKFLIISRPELDLDTAFNCNEPLRSIHRRLALDDTYRPDDDIRLFFSDKFEYIRRTHRLRSIIPITWPTHETLNTLVNKSSGQFIYASTVVKFVESSCHQPCARLNIILGVSPPGNMKPFAELDALYNHILSSVPDDIQITLRVLSLYVMTPNFASIFHDSSMSPELFLSLEPGDIQLTLMNLSSILTYDESSGAVQVLHASLVDFLSDRHRATTFYIDMASTCTDFVRRIIRYVKVPDGIQAGNTHLFDGVTNLYHWILKGQLQSDILNFDLEAFLDESTQRPHNGRSPGAISSGNYISAWWIWEKLITDTGLEDGDKTDALDRLKNIYGSRLKIYESDWRLRLLLTFALANVRDYGPPEIPYCRRLDILLEMDDHDLHLVDRMKGLDFRHAYVILGPKLLDIVALHLDSDEYASAALHCMRFLSNPPKYSERHEYPEISLIYAEWKATCDNALGMLCDLLKQADTSLELVQFISNHDIHSVVQNDFPPDRVLEVDVHIFAFLSRANVYPNWRIISAIQRSLNITRTHQQPESNHAESDEDEGRKVNRNSMRQRLDPCCSMIH